LNSHVQPYTDWVIPEGRGGGGFNPPLILHLELRLGSVIYEHSLTFQGLLKK